MRYNKSGSNRYRRKPQRENRMKFKTDLLTYSHGYTATTQQAQFVNHVHTTYELLFVYRGHGRFLIEDAEYSFLPNALFLIPPGKYHVLEQPPEQDYERCIINFSPRLLPSPIAPGQSFYRVTDDRVRALFQKMTTYTETYAGEALETLLRACITEILVSVILARGEEVEGRNVPPLVKNAIEYINTHLDEPLSVSRIADALFISKTHLSHLFAETMNTGLMHYVIIKKTYAAREMLRNGASVTEVCEHFGYRSYPTFLRNYRAQFGINPSQEKRR